MTMDEMRAEFGDDVAHLVDGVTKLKHLHLTDSTKDPKDKNADRLEMQAENLRKMFLAMAKDIRVILIKLADRLHNMRTLKYQSKEAQQRIARETQDIYCPIAQRLGISKIKIELEDLCMKYLYPDAYYDLVEKVALRKTERDTYIQGLVNDVKKYVSDAGIKAEIYGRAKHFFSIYKKMVNQDKTIDQIYDLFAIRILVDTIPDCYAVLGIIHEKYKPIPGRFKDYIAMPKQNMYQSLHTTLLGERGQPFEVQIRTHEMHKTAEYGIAAHWQYKEGDKHTDLDDKFLWIREILEWQKDLKDSKEFVEYLKLDVYKRISAIENEEEYMDMQDELIDRFGDIPGPVENLLKVAELKAAAHRAYVTEVAVNRQEIRMELYPKAKLDVSGIPGLIGEYKNALRFVQGEKPMMFYQDKRNKNKDCGPMMEKAREILERLGGLAGQRG